MRKRTRLKREPGRWYRPCDTFRGSVEFILEPESLTLSSGRALSVVLALPLHRDAFLERHQRVNGWILR